MFILIYLYIQLGHVACGILVPGPGIEPIHPAVEMQSLNCWFAKLCKPRQHIKKQRCHFAANNSRAGELLIWNTPSSKLLSFISSTETLLSKNIIWNVILSFYLKSLASKTTKCMSYNLSAETKYFKCQDIIPYSQVFCFVLFCF